MKITLTDPSKTPVTVVRKYPLLIKASDGAGVWILLSPTRGIFCQIYPGADDPILIDTIVGDVETFIAKRGIYDGELILKND